MLTKETFPTSVSFQPFAEGGSREGELRQCRIFIPGGNLVGIYQTERRPGLEGCVMWDDTGGKFEGIVTSKEIRLGYGDLVAASYDRDEGDLTSASFSLVNGLKYVADLGIEVSDELLAEVERLKRERIDYVVVVNFNDDGEGDVHLVKTERGLVTELLDSVEAKEMGPDYDVGIADEYDVVDFVLEGEEEMVGELLSAYRQLCPFKVWGAEYGVGVRVLVLDFCIIIPETSEGEEVSALPSHVSQLIDVRQVNDRRLDGQMVRDLARMAFPEID